MNGKLRTTLLAAAIILAGSLMTSCGSALDQFEGNWTVHSVNGKSPADFAAENGVSELGTAKNFSFDDDKVTIEALDEFGAVISQTYSIKPADDGIDIDAAGASVFMEYSEEDGMIKYAVKQNETKYQYLLKKGSTDLGSLLKITQERGSTKTTGTTE